MWNPYRKHFKTEEAWLEGCERMEAKHQCMLANHIIILKSQDYQQYLDYVNAKYGKDYFKKFKMRPKSVS